MEHPKYTTIIANISDLNLTLASTCDLESTLVGISDLKSVLAGIGDLKSTMAVVDGTINADLIEQHVDSLAFAALVADIAQLKAEHTAISKQQGKTIEKLNMLIQLVSPTSESEDSDDAPPLYRRKKRELTLEACKGAPSIEDSPLKMLTTREVVIVPFRRCRIPPTRYGDYTNPAREWHKLLDEAQLDS